VQLCLVWEGGCERREGRIGGGVDAEMKLSGSLAIRLHERADVVRFMETCDIYARIHSLTTDLEK
jgi:hypothetical protein